MIAAILLQESVGVVDRPYCNSWSPSEGNRRDYNIVE